MLRVCGRRFNRKALQYCDEKAYELRAPAIFDGNGSPSHFHFVHCQKTSELTAFNAHHHTWHHPSNPSTGMEASTASVAIRLKQVAYNDMSTRSFSSIRSGKYGGHVIGTYIGMRTCNISHVIDGCNSLARNAFGPYALSNLLIRYSSSANVEDQANAGHKGSGQGEEVPKSKRMQDSQHEELMGFMVEHDISAVANELRQAQQEMLVNMRKCYRALFAVGTIHLIWGLTTFSTLEWPLDHAVLIEICMSGLVFCALAYQMKQTMKPVQFFTNLEQKLKIVFLSRQVSRMLGAFFHRGSGIGFVLACTLAAHALSCIRFLL